MELSDRLVGMDEVARAFSLSKRGAYRVVSEYKLIPPVRVGGALRVRLSDLQRFVATGGKDDAGEA